MATDLSPNRYLPIPGGWRIRIDARAPLPAGCADIGVCTDDPRQHRRPLYPPADRDIFLSQVSAESVACLPLRPLVLAHNAPRFSLDLHHAGGLIGELTLGVTTESGASLWLHDSADLTVSYDRGRLVYDVTDPRLPGVHIALVVAPLADAVGCVIHWQTTGVATLLASFRPTVTERTQLHADASGGVLHQTFPPPKLTPPSLANSLIPDGWTAIVELHAAPAANYGLCQAPPADAAPDAILATAEWQPADRPTALAVLRTTEAEGHLVLGMGRAMTTAPAQLFARAIARLDALASRVVVDTPDPWLNAATTMVAFGLEGIWGGHAFTHGGWTWRFAYLGWRNWYGPTCYGWADRVKTAIDTHRRLTTFRSGDDRGALASLIEFDQPHVYYNMNEVFLDMVRHYFDYTGDTSFMRELFPALADIIAWENRRLRPTAEWLYENALNTWISDSHWTLRGHCAQASAYMLGAHTFMARLAGHLGVDPTTWNDGATRIREAMQRVLWQPGPGVFAEARDTLGHRQLHPEPELPTIYHTAEFGAAHPDQLASMLRWADTHLRHERTPHGGQLVWSSNWHPNRGGSYTHSTYELAFAEGLNYALTNYLAGRADHGWALIAATLCGLFNGPTPGGLSCHANRDGTQRRNDEFADACSMWGRAVCEGLFGIVVKRPEGLVELTPQFPAGWPHAAVQTPHFAYRWQREHGRETLAWTSPVSTSVRLRLPLRAERIVTASAAYTMASGPGFTWLVVDFAAATAGSIDVTYLPAASGPSTPAAVVPRVTRTWSSPGFTDRQLDRWTMIDLATHFNTSLTDAIPRSLAAAKPPPPPASGINFEYRGNHYDNRLLTRGRAGQVLPVSDAAWRARIGPDGIGWTGEGIPFRSPATGDNLAAVSLVGHFPARLDVPIHAAGQTLYLLLTGVTWPMQSHVVNLRIHLHYADGHTDLRDLVNPFDIGDCWDTWLGTFHDTPANGFENLGGRFGPASSRDVSDLTGPIEVDTEAHLLAIPLRHGHPMATLTLEAIANDILFGLMGATLLREA